MIVLKLFTLFIFMPNRFQKRAWLVIKCNCYWFRCTYENDVTSVLAKQLVMNERAVQRDACIGTYFVWLDIQYFFQSKSFINFVIMDIEAFKNLTSVHLKGINVHKGEYLFKRAQNRKKNPFTLNIKSATPSMTLEFLFECWEQVMSIPVILLITY